MQRLVFLVGLLKNHAKSPLRHANEVHAELESWNKGRNAKAHDSIPGTDRKLYIDEELEVLIGKAKVLLPRINGWEKNSDERKRIDDRLNALQACLDGEDVPAPESTQVNERASSNERKQQLPEVSTTGFTTSIITQGHL